jgi:MFS family permease
MHFDDTPPASPPISSTGKQSPWYRELTGYHWFVLIVASLGWMFDTMDQQLFNLARKPAITQLLHASPNDKEMAGTITRTSGYATTIFMIGWAIGGLIFGVVGDRIGRAKTMMITILLYAAFTGLSALSVGVYDFALYRFLTGLGVGGEFAVGVALVAETMSDRARPFALGWLQALSAIGNMTASVINIFLGRLQESGAVDSAWRAMFLVGVLPAILVVPIFLWLREPDKWKEAVARRKQEIADGLPGDAPRAGSFKELFGDPIWRRNTIVGMLLAFSGVVGLWGIGFFSPDLMDTVFRKAFQAEGVPEKLIPGKITLMIGIAFFLQNFGAFLGVNFFSLITHRIGRKPAFAISFVLAMLATAFTFWFMGRLFGYYDVFPLVTMMGFFQIALFGGYAIYLPELFPTRLRSTGTSFCYNVGRLVAAAGPLTLGHLSSDVFGGFDEPMRYAGVTMCLVFLIGLAALPFAPETRGKPLPE